MKDWKENLKYDVGTKEKQIKKAEAEFFRVLRNAF